MELIVIDQNKLKIMLSAPDMTHYDLHAEHMNSADAETRRAFRHIFDDAREQIGFDTEGERLLVQLYTSRSGGCEIFVTKLGPDTGEACLPETSFAEASAFSPDAEEALLRRIHKADAWKPAAAYAEKEMPMTTSLAIYRFENIHALIIASRRLLSIGYAATSTLYRAEHLNGEAWYLTLAIPSPCPLSMAFLSEYAEAVSDPDMLALYLTEHAHAVAPEGAVEALGKM